LSKTKIIFRINFAKGEQPDSEWKPVSAEETQPSYAILVNVFETKF
jgi:hypothetical protein